MAYDFAKAKGVTERESFKKCFQYEGRSGRIALKDLFDLVAGTSTGSIIAAGLTYPRDDAGHELNEWIPKFWGKDLTEIYSKNGDKIFKDMEGINPVLEVFLILLYLVVFGAIGFYFGRRWFDNPEREKLFDNMQKLVNC